MFSIQVSGEDVRLDNDQDHGVEEADSPRDLPRFGDLSPANRLAMGMIEDSLASRFDRTVPRLRMLGWTDKPLLETPTSFYNSFRYRLEGVLTDRSIGLCFDENVSDQVDLPVFLHVDPNSGEHQANLNHAVRGNTKKNLWYSGKSTRSYHLAPSDDPDGLIYVGQTPVIELVGSEDHIEAAYMLGSYWRVSKMSDLLAQALRAEDRSEYFVDDPAQRPFPTEEFVQNLSDSIDSQIASLGSDIHDAEDNIRENWRALRNLLSKKHMLEEVIEDEYLREGAECAPDYESSIQALAEDDIVEAIGGRTNKLKLLTASLTTEDNVELGPLHVTFRFGGDEFSSSAPVFAYCCPNDEREKRIDLFDSQIAEVSPKLIARGRFVPILHQVVNLVRTTPFNDLFQ